MARAIYTNDYDYYKHFKSNDLGVKYELEYTKIKDSVLIMKELPEDNMESSNIYIVAGPNVGKHYLKQYRLMEDVSNCIFLGDAVFESVPVPSNYISSPINWYLWYHNLYEYQTLQDRTHWWCFLEKKRKEREVLADAFARKQSIFEHDHYFVYDGNHAQHGLSDYHTITDQSITRADYEHEPLAPHFDSIVELTIETMDNCFFMTEKVLRPIVFGVPFIALGCRHYMRRIRAMGFKTFESCIDESYDNHTDLQDRCSHAIDSMQNFLSNPIDYKTLQRTVEHNQTNLKKIQKFSYMDRLTTRIKRVFNTNPKLTF